MIHALVDALDGFPRSLSVGRLALKILERAGEVGGLHVVHEISDDTTPVGFFRNSSRFKVQPGLGLIARRDTANTKIGLLEVFADLGKPALSRSDIF